MNRIRIESHGMVGERNIRQCTEEAPVQRTSAQQAHRSLLAGFVLLVAAITVQARDFVVASPTAPAVCREYADAINTRRVAAMEAPLACDRGLWDDPLFSPGARRVPIPAAQENLLLLEVAELVSSNDRADLEAQQARARQLAATYGGDTKVSPYRGSHLELASRFEPWIDINNDGVAEDVALVGYYGMPCGIQTQHAQMINTVSLVVLDSSGSVDLERTLKLYEPGRWAVWSSVQADQRAGRKSQSLALEWADLFSVFRYRGTVYFDRLGYRNPDRGPSQMIYGVFKATPQKVEQVCELRVKK